MERIGQGENGSRYIDEGMDMDRYILMRRREMNCFLFLATNLKFTFTLLNY